MEHQTVTAAQAAARAAEVLERADCEPNPHMVEAKVRIADGWTELATALAEMEQA
ncbi:hypothetical protein ACQP1V_42665 (plasmid) [Microtetraspora malaysiensis]|uniref:hypothetical protein n=1 Tax=Microtetraspora malaysiensis TaxID=161358 RepID=UPI003D8F09D1